MDRETTLALEPGGRVPVWQWVVRARRGSAWTTVILPGWQRTYTVPSADEFAVSAVDRIGHEGPVTRVPGASPAETAIPATP